MLIPPAELTKRRLRSVSWCVLCHAAAVACLQAVLQFSPLHPYLWLLSTLRSVLCFKFLATLVQISVLTAALIVFISKSLPNAMPKVHFSKMDFASNQQPWQKKKAVKFSPYSILLAVRKFPSLLYELPMSALSGENLYILLGNNLTALLVGLLFLNTENKTGMQLFFFLLAGSFASISNSSGHRFLDAAPVVNLPLRTQIRAIFTDTVRSLFLPCLKSFASINAFISLIQLMSVIWSKDANILSIFSHLSLPFLLHTFIVYFFLVTILTLTHKVTLAVFMTNWHFPIEAQDENSISLLDALESTKDLQLAASRDLVFLSELDAQRRAEFWVLSQPGGHPKRFNSLVKVFTKAVDKFKDDLTEKPEIGSTIRSPLLSSGSSFGQPDITSTPTRLPTTPAQLPSTPVQPLASRFRGLLFQTPQTPTIRPMDAVQSPLRLSTPYTSPASAASSSPVESVFGYVTDYFRPKEEMLNTNKKHLAKAASTVLSDAPYLSYLSSGISTLALASVAEDKYGIVQLKLQEIVAGLLSLTATARSNEKLGLVLTNAKMRPEEVAEVNKALDLVQETASRALCKIGKTFGKSLFDLRWNDADKETLTLFVA